MIKMPTRIGTYRITDFRTATRYNYIYDGISRTGRRVVVKVAVDEAHSAVPFVEHGILRLASHPNIVKVFSCGKNKKLGYVVSEMLQGLCLHNHLLRVGTINPIEVVNQLLSIAQGLLPLWQANIPHGDIQPGNIIANGRGWVLYDFHSVAQYRVGICDSYGIPTIFPYAAPERFEGYDPNYVPSPTDDFYSLGVIALEAIVGQHVLAKNEGDVTGLVDNLAHPLIVHYPKAFRNLLKRCCGSDLNLRIRNPVEFINRLAALKGIRWE